MAASNRDWREQHGTPSARLSPATVCRRSTFRLSSICGAAPHAHDIDDQRGALPTGCQRRRSSLPLRILFICSTRFHSFNAAWPCACCESRGHQVSSRAGVDIMERLREARVSLKRRRCSVSGLECQVGTGNLLDCCGGGSERSWKGVLEACAKGCVPQKKDPVKP